MPRKKLIRRLEPRFGVSQPAIEAEADALRREAKDYELLALSDLDTRRVERHANAHHAWEELHLLLRDLPEREQKTIQCLLFRDIFHILELYLAHLRRSLPQPSMSTACVEHASRKSLEFSEWLFDPGKE